MNKIELLAPAKDLEKAKIAIMYGADAVYVGGKSFSLRSRASNFEMDDIIESINNHLEEENDSEITHKNSIKEVIQKYYFQNEKSRR